MTKMRLLLNTLAVFVVCLALNSAANAQATRTWVSGVGDDVNPCSRTAPCKTFAGAISKTATAGEISVLDPAGFGALTITKSITVNGTGTLAGITASLVNGIIVNGAGAKVILKHLQINGAGNGLDAIRYLQGSRLVVENCNIYAFTGDGIEVALNNAGGTLAVSNTDINDVNTGVRMSVVAPGFATATFDHVRIQGVAADGINVTTTNCTAQFNQSSITNATGSSVRMSAAGVVNLESTIIFGSTNGINAATSGSLVRMSNVNVFNNGNGIVIAAGATVRSFINNRIDGNGVDGAPNATKVQQ